MFTLGYIWSCGVFPYKACRSCRGQGIFRSAIFGAIRLCRRCDGTGRVLRFGRRLYNRWTRVRRAIRADRQRDRRDDHR
ncbi:hypothetical protein DMH04_38105 [Kibdelosporangium aridum]|uniref:Uncharacterized protein n=1 Tax=Kibdelosporangium aridum TaxID=2030 RepID=A0A428YY82_KIBAR|nr:hypothetical protein DMH04_38105 [Kibdelosporangium aridum]